ncbi:hypothetical protein CPB85DRAFT_1438347 [Mucidula mucida]|nr:hypothetical protein CPB85DRAFT_1438347 [Mucidula mucida]
MDAGSSAIVDNEIHAAPLASSPDTKFCVPEWTCMVGDKPRDEHGEFFLVRQGSMVGVFSTRLLADRLISGRRGGAYDVYTSWEHAVQEWQRLCSQGELGSHTCPHVIPDPELIQRRQRKPFPTYTYIPNPESSSVADNHDADADEPSPSQAGRHGSSICYALLEMDTSPYSSIFGLIV